MRGKAMRTLRYYDGIKNLKKQTDILLVDLYWYKLTSEAILEQVGSGGGKG